MKRKKNHLFEIKHKKIKKRKNRDLGINCFMRSNMSISQYYRTNILTGLLGLYNLIPVLASEKYHYNK